MHNSICTPSLFQALKEGPKQQSHLKKYYKTFDEIKSQGLDALIISGANVSQPNLELEPFYEQLREVVDWSYENVTSTLCSCLATHAVLEFRYGQKRQVLLAKNIGESSHIKWPTEGTLCLAELALALTFPILVLMRFLNHNLMRAGVKILAKSPIGVHLAVSPDLFRIVFFQGHPEYDTISLLKEYKREITLYLEDKELGYPPMPSNYLSVQNQAILNEYRTNLDAGIMSFKDFPESLISTTLDNTWHDSANAIINNWIGCVYQVTNERDRQAIYEWHQPRRPP